MAKNFIITIGRQYGSGGHEIARELAKILDVKMYDKELIELGAIKSGISEDVLHMYDEHPTNSLLYSMSLGVNPFNSSISGMSYVPLGDRVFSAQADVIREIAEKDESCIFVGRCANSILKDKENVINIFIHADIEQRIDRICEYEKISRGAAESIIRKADKRRAGYCSHFTGFKWGDVAGYDICINSGIGYENVVQLIKTLVENLNK
ncbi:MAG: cytidylate kinase-like family protein [Ruminococcaceae bacterium]|nr:cytidylate kinase-like family protein [Oscillospiraceae bacterium]